MPEARTKLPIEAYRMVVFRCWSGPVLTVKMLQLRLQKHWDTV